MKNLIRNSSGSNLAEEARISIIDLAAALYQGGEKDYLQKILAMLVTRIRWLPIMPPSS